MYNRYFPYQYNRSEKQVAPPPVLTQKEPPVSIPGPTPISVPKPLPPNPPRQSPPHHRKPEKKKITFRSLKEDTCTSLNDVECFLNNFTSTLKYIKLINLLK